MNRIEEKFEGKVRLIHGCINPDRSIASRDAYYTKYFDSVELARAKLKEHSDFRSSIFEYQVWFNEIAVWNEKEKKYKPIK